MRRVPAQRTPVYSCLLGLPKVNRLGQMRRSDLLIPRQVRNRPRDFEHAMERPRRKLQLLASRRRPQ
jgi:hypothetical protein